MASTPPRIFSDRRRVSRRQRALSQQTEPGFVLDDMVEDVLDRLAFTRHEPERSLIVGDTSGRIAASLEGEVITRDITRRDALDLEAPYPSSDFDLIAVFGLLDAVNDLPGALVHIRNALAPGGMAIASFVGGASLKALRRAMFEAEAERPAARMHPLIDHRAAPGLLQRAGWADPVVDSHSLTVRYSSLERLVQDLREMGLGNVLASPGPPLTHAAYHRARDAFAAQADADGKVSETFEIITLTGRKSRPRF
ncbi:methyltransferase domain-containing protein [Aurantiacibacter aquimixticola]|uniref:Methyltransferase domain-containing protein n=1 Tax=Aurantiacibacter aquimixticola TaxID=1958945 RepID=A0A419RRV0_9SPHN|nr:methyltransferase domain-containing protein [Aurantiacibacter aquimixticola]RJY08505.1 methyltransferase domain-containing protein [Aurantiacibacter aquimixticola]